MEPVTHILTGACLARTGLNRRAAYATLAMGIGAEFPDIDTLWSLRGPVASFQHHRGLTHTFAGIPVEAAAIVALIYAWHRWRLHRAARTASLPNRALTTVAPHWGWLYLFTLLALLSHLFLDWTNNYGLRPFLPFHPRWYAASITFIFDPLMFLLLLSAVVLPSIFRLVSSEIGARRQPFAAKGWAVAALLGVAGLWTLRAVEHNKALLLATSQTVSYVPQTPSGVMPSSDTSADASAPAPDQAAQLLQAQRALANPDPFNPFRWWMVTDFGPVYQLSEANTLTGTIIPSQRTQPKPDDSPSVRTAKASTLGRAYIDWSPMPFITVTNASQFETENEPGPDAKVVVFRDPRFMGDIPGMHGRTPLGGRVMLDATNHVLGQSIDGKVQHGLPEK